MEKYTIIVEQDEDGVLIGSAVELPGCHTQAGNYNELFSCPVVKQLYSKII